MKLNHINLVVADVAAAINLFETYFNFKCTDVKGNNIVAILKGEGDFTLVLMNSKEAPVYPKAFHIGFLLENEEQVNSTYQKLKTSGVPVEMEPQRIRDGFGFYFTFDTVMIEVGIA